MAVPEIAGSNIRINIVCPRLTERARLIENLAGSSPRERVVGVVPLHRLAEPEEVEPVWKNWTVA